MIGHWQKEFEKIARKGINNYAALFNHPPDRVGIKMLLTDQKNVQFFITKDRGKDMTIEQVRFTQLYHSPSAKMDFTGMCYMIPAFIAKILQRLIDRFRTDPGIFSVQVLQEQNDLFVFAMEGSRIIKMIQMAELFDDDQINIDLLETSQK